MDNSREQSYNLKKITSQLVAQFPEITNLYLFGSRAQRTRSPRSDVDILVTTNAHIRSTDLRNFSELHCPALDLFIVTGSKAVSCMNDSYIEENDLPALIELLGAIKFWSIEQSFLEVDIDWMFTTPTGVLFTYTTLTRPQTNPFINWAPAINKYFQLIERENLPIQPFLGGDIKTISEFIIKLTKKFVSYTGQLNTNGHGLSFSFDTEYDYQNLFFIVTKPWISSLSKNPFTIQFDGQEKFADFGLFNNQIIIEMKHIRDASTKAAVVKTLEGLASFYTQAPNIKALIFVVFVNHAVEIDTAQWEERYSFLQRAPKIFTVVVRAPENNS